MQQTYVKYLCDLCGAELEQAAPLKITIGGKAYEVDLCDDDRKPIDLLHDQLKASDAQRRNTGTRGRRARPAAEPASTDNGSNGDGHVPVSVPATAHVPNNKAAEYATPIRDWARANGMAVSARGRIPGAIVKAYQQSYRAHIKGSTTTAA